MKIPRPMGFVRSVVFFPTFILARIPFWFIIASLILTPSFKLEYAITMIVAIFFARSFIESELAAGGFLIFSLARVARFFAAIFIAVAIDLFFLFYIFASPIDKALISVLFIILVLLFFDVEFKKGYWQGYTLPIATTIILTCLWAYLLIINDTLFGYITIVAAIYIIEFFQLFFNKVITGLEVFDLP